jgi:endonuclease-8
MPEGHTIHRLAREMSELRGQTLRASSPQGRFTDGAADIDGAVLELAEGYGKHLLLHLSSGDSVHVHLGMQGKWLRSTDPSAPPLPQVRLRLTTDGVAWNLVAPSKCELLDPPRVAALLLPLGPDPLRSDVNLEDALQALGSATGPIGAVLLDQTVVAGIGNVFRAEALHAVGVAPRRQAGTMTESELRALWTVLQQMMSRAVEEGRIITVDGPNRLTLPESEARRVYKQERCRDCGAPVVIDQVGGRTAYHCPIEQPS